jgi:hypoxanthine phosphoribosyltransferase
LIYFIPPSLGRSFQKPFLRGLKRGNRLPVNDFSMKKRITAHDLSFETYIDSGEIAARVTAIGHQISEDYSAERPLFLCILNGSFIFAADLVRASECECEVAFIRLASYDGTQSSGEVTTVYGLDISVKNRHIIVVEDIIDSGETMRHFLAELKKKEPASVKLAVLLLKPDALKHPVEVD